VFYQQEYVRYHTETGDNTRSSPMAHHDHERVHDHDHGQDHDSRHGHDHLHDHFFAGGPRRGRWGGGERGGWAGGRRMRRGAIRTAVLIALREEPAHGYEVMRRLEEMSGGLWRPSPGSVYPHLQMLEDEGLLQSSDVDGSRTYTLTDAGRAEAEKATLPWQELGEADNGIRDLRQGMGQLMSAAKQLAGAGEKAQIERGIAVIQKARKELYQILAED
jgi:DNA-binding PadR family transcriptional regulator